MLRHMISSMSILLTILGCQDNVSIQGKPATSNGEIKITDTNGQPRMIFHTGEEFLVSDQIKNTTMRRISCAFTGPPVRFDLTQGDSVISSSVDAWPLIMIYDTLDPGESIGCTWRAPSEYWHDPVVVLGLGLYKVNVISWPDFDSLSVAPPKSSIILIIP